MGRGIATALAFGRVDVVVVDLPDRGDAAIAYRESVRSTVDRALDLKVELGLLDRSDLPEVRDRVRVVDRSGAASLMASAQMVFEAVPEVMDAKRAALRWIESTAGADVPIASTTSTFLVDHLADCLSRPHRLLNAHWLNPADLMPLVEVSPSARTDGSVLSAACALLASIGKSPVVCAASHGYIVPRLQALVMNEAARMVDEGVASAEEIDRAVRIGFGSRFAVLGLLEFIDWGGCDTLYHASRYLQNELGERFAPAELVERKMAAHRRGVEDGAGFYAISPSAADGYRAERTAKFVEVLAATGNLHGYASLPIRDTPRRAVPSGARS